LGDKKKHKVTVILKDTQSDLGRASQVAQDLVANEKVMLIGASAGADTVVPVSGSGRELRLSLRHLRLPCRRMDGDQPEGGYKWCWHTWFVFRDLATNFVAVWDALTTNKVVGGVYPNDGDGHDVLGRVASGIPGQRIHIRGIRAASRTARRISPA